MLTYSTMEEIYEKANQLYENKENAALEKLFSKNLKGSVDLRLWNLYIKYVREQQKESKLNLNEVFSFVLSYMEHSYEIYDLVKAFISDLEHCSMEEGRIERIRKVFFQFLKLPNNRLSRLWLDYEQWEHSVNKINSKSFIEEILPYYQNACSVFQKILSALHADDFYRIINIETTNPLKLTKKTFESRLNFVFAFLISKNYNYDDLTILRSFYLKDDTSNHALTFPQTFWFSFFGKKNLFDFRSSQHGDIVNINYCLWVVQNEGMEAFRSKFQEMVLLSVGYRVHINAAEIELVYGKSPANAYKILSDAHAKFGDEPLLCEKFFEMFLKLNEEERTRLLFKKLGKTERMWNQMIEYCFRFGDFNEYMILLQARDKDRINNLILPPVSLHTENSSQKNSSVHSGSKGIIKSIYANFGYLDINLFNDSVIDKFLKKLPQLRDAENIMKNVDVKRLVEIIKTIKVPK